MQLATYTPEYFRKLKEGLDRLDLKALKKIIEVLAQERVSSLASIRSIMKTSIARRDDPGCKSKCSVGACLQRRLMTCAR